MHEKKLIKQCLKQNRKAQETLYNKYKDAMYSICLRFTSNQDDAREALQEGFITVFTELKKFRGESGIGSWIRTIMIRNAIKVLKRKKIYFIESSNITDSITWDDNLTGDLLHEAIINLSDGYRTVFLLYEVEGYSHSEISQMLNISEGTSKSQLFYAKRKLRNFIKKHENYGIQGA
ncbi:MAG TPA: RNA polymerase sigma factor [Bacteroidales bacterium]|nr:RNA polymerase sigma factor [Bacteroidales bacterium]